MEYNKNSEIKKKTYTNMVLKKKSVKNNLKEINLLENKINELEKKIEFYKKYKDNLNNTDLHIINKSVLIIDQLIDNLTKNIIIKAHVNRNIKNIEFEF